MYTVIINQAQCTKCGDIITSDSPHNFVTCRCGSVSVDGGKEIIRRVYQGDYLERSVIIDESGQKMPLKDYQKYIVRIKCEVLYEKLFRIMSEYAIYIDNTPDPPNEILDNYKRMGTYPGKILDCNDEETYIRLDSAVSSFEEALKRINKP